MKKIYGVRLEIGTRKDYIGKDQLIGRWYQGWIMMYSGFTSTANTAYSIVFLNFLRNPYQHICKFKQEDIFFFFSFCINQNSLYSSIQAASLLWILGLMDIHPLSCQMLAPSNTEFH